VAAFSNGTSTPTAPGGNAGQQPPRNRNLTMLGLLPKVTGCARSIARHAAMLAPLLVSIVAT